MKKIYRIPINLSVGIPLVISLIILLIIPWLSEKDLLHDVGFFLLLASSFFFIGCSGIPIIIARKLPAFMLNLFGGGELVSGIILTVFGFGSSLVLTIGAITQALK